MEETTKPKYDPSKNYQWEPTTEFVFTGQDFGLILNTFRSILLSAEYQKMKMIEKASARMESALVKAVEEGKVIETPRVLPTAEIEKGA